MTTLRALIVDDEEKGRKNLCRLLEKHCPEVRIVGMADSAGHARTLVAAEHPDLVFLDVRMPEQDGFAFLQSYEQRRFFVIFVTAFTEYAISAIKLSALDYLLKPINIHELQQAVAKCMRILAEMRAGRQAWPAVVSSALLPCVHEDCAAGAGRLLLEVPLGYRLVDIRDILYLKADGAYTILTLSGNEQVCASQMLKDIESRLDPEMF